jgi:aminoglycoside 6'-N-acetyltransferase
MPKDVRLDAVAPADRDLLRGWLRRPHVSRWWGAADDSFAAVTRQPATDQAVISVGGRPVGYLLWRRLEPAEVAVAGLGDLPSDHVDVDILIGEPELMGQGIGPAALHLILGRLGAEGVSSVGVGTDLANQRARRAFEKAGFRLFRQFEENGRSMCYLIREPGSAV